MCWRRMMMAGGKVLWMVLLGYFRAIMLSHVFRWVKENQNTDTPRYKTKFKEHMVQMLNIQNKSQITIIISAIIIQIIPALLKTITTTTTIKTNSLFRKKKQLSNKYKLLYAFHFENFLQYLSQHIRLHVPPL